MKWSTALMLSALIVLTANHFFGNGEPLFKMEIRRPGWNMTVDSEHVELHVK